MAIDFLSRLTPEQLENIERKEQDLQRRTIGQVIAIDTQGNEFIKTVTLEKDYKVIDFEWPCSYHLLSTYERLKENESNRFTLDLGGRNHKGYEVFLRIEDALGIFEKAVELKKELEKDNNV